MFKIFIRAIIALFCLCASVSGAAAQTIGEPSSTFNYPIQDGLQTVFGQAVAPPAGRLDSYTLYVSRSSATLSLIPFVYEWTGDPQAFPVAPIWTGAPVPVTSTVIAPITFNTGGLILDPTKIYVLAARPEIITQTGAYAQNDAGTYAPASRVYGDNTTLNGGGVSVRDLQFSATFSAVSTVPTAGEWTMILLGLAIAGFAVVLLQRRFVSA